MQRLAFFEALSQKHRTLASDVGYKMSRIVADSTKAMPQIETDAHVALQALPPRETADAQCTLDMRLTIVAWLFEVSTEMKYKVNVVHCAVILFDEYMKHNVVSVRNLQLYSSACFMVAVKMCSSMHMNISDIKHCCADTYSVCATAVIVATPLRARPPSPPLLHSLPPFPVCARMFERRTRSRTLQVSQIVQAELDVVQGIRYDIFFPTSTDFIDLSLGYVQISSDVRRVIFYVLELCILHPSIFFEFTSAELGAHAIRFAASVCDCIELFSRRGLVGEERLAGTEMHVIALISSASMFPAFSACQRTHRRAVALVKKYFEGL